MINDIMLTLIFFVGYWFLVLAISHFKICLVDTAPKFFFIGVPLCVGAIWLMRYITI